jgi:hypothetical protein
MRPPGRKKQLALKYCRIVADEIQPLLELYPQVVNSRLWLTLETESRAARDERDRDDIIVKLRIFIDASAYCKTFKYLSLCGSGEAGRIFGCWDGQRRDAVSYTSRELSVDREGHDLTTSQKVTRRGTFPAASPRWSGTHDGIAKWIRVGRVVFSR